MTWNKEPDKQSGKSGTEDGTNASRAGHHGDDGKKLPSAYVEFAQTIYDYAKKNTKSKRLQAIFEK